MPNVETLGGYDAHSTRCGMAKGEGGSKQGDDDGSVRSSCDIGITVFL